jgi:hypothetical protein
LLERVLFGLAGILVLIGLGVFAGGWLNIGQLWPEYAQMGRFEAAAFILFGLGILARSTGRRTAEWRSPARSSCLEAGISLWGLL